MTDYNKHDHIHCFNQEESPCGIKGKHRCCLCEEEVMKTTPQKPERSVEEIVEEWNEYNADKGGLLYPNRNEDWLTQTLQAERQKRAEEIEKARQEERVRIERIVLSIDKPCLCSPLHANPCCAFYRQFSVFREEVLRGVNLSTPKD